MHSRFRLRRIVFVGDRGMVTDKNINELMAGKHGYLVGVRRRRNSKIEQTDHCARRRSNRPFGPAARVSIVPMAVANCRVLASPGTQFVGAPTVSGSRVSCSRTL